MTISALQLFTIGIGPSSSHTVGPMRAGWMFVSALSKRGILSRTARLRIELHDLVWNGIYVPIADAVGFTSARLNRLQFLTIRRYLSLVFATLVTLLLVLAIWS